MENSDFRTSTRLGHQSQASTVAILPSEPPPRSIGKTQRLFVEPEGIGLYLYRRFGVSIRSIWKTCGLLVQLKGIGIYL